MATTISRAQIRDGAINDAKVGAGAGIATSKLADGVNMILRTGAVAFTADQSMGGFKLTSVATGTNANDAVNLSQMEAAISALNSLFDSKPSVKAASTGNVTVSNPGTSTFDGVSLSNGDRLLLRAQSAPEQNGIYVFNGSGSALTRATDMDAWAEVPGALVAVEEGSTYADYLFLSTANTGGTLGTTGITWTQVNGAGYTTANFIDRETPSGSINGSNTAFTLANTPTAGSEHIYLNGVLQLPGAVDYSISGAAITMVAAPETGDWLRASYRI